MRSSEIRQRNAPGATGAFIGKHHRLAINLMRGFPMDQYTDFTSPNQPKTSQSEIFHWLQLLLYPENRSTSQWIDAVLRDLMHRMLINKLPPPDTWSKIKKRACSVNQK